VLPRGALVARAAARYEPPATERGLEVVAFVAAQIGRPYCWGGTGPYCFDCSGLTQTAWARAGVPVPRTTGAIAAALPEVPLGEVRAGDILWWPGHVGIYAGQGWMIDALDARHGVVVRPASDPYRVFRPPS
jgi:cell wall-associated NlpC family hydrolase